MARVTPDKDNPRSRGYICRKGAKVALHQHHADRLSQPLNGSETNLSVYPGIRPSKKFH